MNNTLWEEISNMFSNCSREIRVNRSEAINGEYTLDKLQITPKSALGSVLLHTSGIIVENWIRVLGSDSKKNRGILSYNRVNEVGVATKIDKMLIVADDVVGGIFALNTGRLSNGVGDIWYFAPDTLEWESLEMKYSEFIAWVVNGNIDEFYSNMRWNAWEKDVKDVEFDDAILIYPFLWANEIQLENAEKKVVLAEELFNLNQEYSEKFNLS
ncbi:DUF2625 family protein [Bacillus sp. XF8]|uniref:DUF2625 family protein n=1 Tax=Bacillus sp. XF8 TaxID=2819289 RepID=UPI001FB6D0E5|nr:DUF2625 family protein [Bacillus sp. XF8]